MIHLEKFKLTYILLIIIASLYACKSTKYVPEGRSLLKKNELIITGDKTSDFDPSKISEGDIEGIIRQQANYKRFFIKWKLMAYNLIDSSKVADKRVRKNLELREENRERVAKQNRINLKRIDRAVRNGDSLYTAKIIPLKDTVTPKKFLREWYKYKIGEPPVIFDSLPYNKTLQQISSYARSRGYYRNEVIGNVKFQENRKVIVTYELITGPRYYIDSVSYETDNVVVKNAYEKFILSKNETPLLNDPFDRKILDKYRNEVAKFMRNESLYGFNASQISFEADTTKLPEMSVNLKIKFGNRLVKREEFKDSLFEIPHVITKVEDVYFHIADTTLFPGNFVDSVKKMGISKFEGKFLTTIDTLHFDALNGSDPNKINRKAIFTYNGKLFVSPYVLESYNYLEKGELYREKHLERSYLRLIQSGLFQVVKTEMDEVPGSGELRAHYYLIPTKRQNFGVEPRATNTNGFLGASATINYTNRNLFRGAEKFTVSLSGGFESQPPIFDETLEGVKIKTASRSFNTFEIGPSVKIELPGAFPLKLNKLDKRRHPYTVISTAYNFQKRSIFTRGTFQANYIWRFSDSKTKIYNIGFPGVSVIKFVDIFNESQEFKDKLVQLNDLFLLNAYSKQFIWQDWKFTFEYNSKEKENKKHRDLIYFYTTFDPSGNILGLFKKSQDTISGGSYSFFNIAYAQFLRLDNQMIYSLPLRKDKSVNFRVIAGGGYPYGNSKTLPYDYSFFGGGANDNRGWRARSLGPGSYKYFLDTNRTATQIGDIRLGGSAEFRFAFNSLFKGALFIDAGNIWTVDKDNNRPGGQFSSNWYNEIAIASGFGIRLDLEYFIIRVDIGFPMRDPALPDRAQWFFQERQPYYEEGEAEFGKGYEQYLPNPFTPKIHFGIGYPF